MAIIMPCLFIGLAFYIVYRIIKKPFDEQVETTSTRAAQASVYSFEKKYHDNGFTGVLFVQKKSEPAIKALEFSEVHDIHVTTTPDKLVYTGATVGGVTPAASMCKKVAHPHPSVQVQDVGLSLTDSQASLMDSRGVIPLYLCGSLLFCMPKQKMM